MKEIKRSAVVAQSQSRVYALINDIESYPQFVPGCTQARVEARNSREIIATLTVRRGPLKAQFTTRNELEPEQRIRMSLLRGPFSKLQGEWLLTPIDADSCRVDLSMCFAFAHRLTAYLFEPLFQDTAASLVDAFVARARAA
ncbi:MAG TPA: type II toxin-antitoxin system RatA family toxin [Steroidobacteraceae bacterium]|nr:type II toxin-antitoxin system RatA family toxin [Steroidobacteraceae bacterium]